MYNFTCSFRGKFRNDSIPQLSCSAVSAGESSFYLFQYTHLFSTLPLRSG